MHILLVTQYYWPEPFRITDLAEALVQHGCRVTVLTGKPNYPEGRRYPGYHPWKTERETRNGVRILRVPHAARGRGGALRLAVNYLSFAASATVAGPLMRIRNVDAILVYQPSPVTVGIPAAAMKLRHRCPLFFWVQDLWPESLEAAGAVTSPRILGMVGRLVGTLYRSCDRILVQSRAFVPAVAARGVPERKILYFPNSAEPLYRPVRVPADSPARRLMPSTGFRILFAGNLGEAQDLPTLLGAAELLHDRDDLHWIILGEGRRARWLEEEIRARRLEHRILMLGRHDTRLMPHFFALADALLLTLGDTPAYNRTLPSKLQSYLACARPVLCSASGESARVVREAGAGLTSAPGRPESLAAAVEELMQLPPSERVAMGERGRRYFLEHFERERLVERLIGWLRQAVEEPSLSGGGGDQSSR